MFKKNFVLDCLSMMFHLHTGENLRWIAELVEICRPSQEMQSSHGSNVLHRTVIIVFVAQIAG